MSSGTVQARITPKLKKEAEKILASMGMKTSDAIRIFLPQCVNIGGGVSTYRKNS